MLAQSHASCTLAVHITEQTYRRVLADATRVWIGSVHLPVVMLPGGLVICVVVGSGDDPNSCSSLRPPPLGVLPPVPWLSLLLLPGVGAPVVMESVPVSPAGTAVAFVLAAAVVLASANSTTHSQNKT